MPEHLSRVDVLVLPSVWLENSPLVIKEAFAAGVPVVTSDLGGMAELVRRDVDGLLFEPGNADALAVAATAAPIGAGAARAAASRHPAAE